MDVRRLAAVDMWGSAGTLFRRRAILVEFIIGATGGPVLGLWVISQTRSAGWVVFGAWLVGVGINYVPLALHALALSGPGRLEAELAGVDVLGELRYYTLVQFWVFVPLLMALLGWWQRRKR